MNNDITVEILKDIRSAIHKTNEDLSARIDDTNRGLSALRGELREEVGSLREELSKRIVASEVRTATAIGELASSVHDVASLLREQRDLRPRVEKCESEIAELKKRIPAA